ncbi:hypothetical protein BDN67DRAFT_860273, partial [Paxillus ammoniavirescens]
VVDLDSELQELASELDEEDSIAITENGDGDPDSDDVDHLHDWVDEIDELTEEERSELYQNIRPIRFLLVKLRKLAFKIIHSTTIILPEWKRTLGELKLPVRIMPRDVSTRWNSTFDMLEFALKYRQAVDAITDKRKLGL